MKLSDIIFENKVKEINFAYTDPGARLYSITINGQKQRGDDHKKAIDMIQKLTGKEVPIRAMYHSQEVQDLIDALKAKGIQSDVYPMDVS